jgi:type IV pilus assembly protein PilP
MAQQRSQTPSSIEQIQPPKPFEPFRFAGAGKPDPFALANLSGKGEARDDRLRPDETRPREALENYPLETLRMVGRLTGRSGDYALLQYERELYRVRVGNFAGQNHGRIERITDREVVLKETVQDAAGDWVERDTVLQLQEGGK